MGPLFFLYSYFVDMMATRFCVRSKDDTPVALQVKIALRAAFTVFFLIISFPVAKTHNSSYDD